MVIRNPILPGFYPDPSVCRVGRDYYLVSSSFEYFPGVPIFHSADLVNWEQIGHCLTRKSQLDLTGALPSSGIFAPTLRYHRGVFYMITTNVGGCGNFYVTATDPAGPWSEPVLVDGDWFDPSLFFEDDGRAYYTRRGGRGIVQAEIDVETGRLTTELEMICERFICSDIEGPHLYKIDGVYFLMAAEGGSRFGHGEVIGRSDSPWGPFEPCPHNPILTHRDRGHGAIRDVGHAELVQDHNGRWWAFCLGTRHLHYNSFSLLGREIFLAPVVWTEDGWPVVGDGGAVAESFRADLFPAQLPVPDVWRDDFDGADLDHRWNFLRNPRDEDWSLGERPGYLRLRGSPVSLADRDSPAFLGRRQQHFGMTASCLLDFAPQAENEEAGLTAFMNDCHHYAVVVAMRQGRRCVVVKKRVGDMAQEVASDPLGPGPVRLAVSADSSYYRFSYAQDGREVRPLASGLGRLLSPEIAADDGSWTGVYLAMFASGNGRPCRRPADFDWFEYRAVI